MFQEFWLRLNGQEPAPLVLRRAIERYCMYLYHEQFDSSSVARKISCFRSFERF